MASDRRMKKYPGFVLLLSLAAPALADSDGDAVNERIPVERAALEEHWQVDCAGAWARLQDAVAQRSTRDHCGVSAALVREIKLCGFIYQPPGEDSRHQCPDYRGVARQLELSGASGDCPELPPALARQLDCADTPHYPPASSGTGGDPIP
jgi:hypothetical protein